jgi:hypothetical protein
VTVAAVSPASLIDRRRFTELEDLNAKASRVSPRAGVRIYFGYDFF